MVKEVQSSQSQPTLADCADEPIHIPGAIQPHGCLLVLEDGRLLAWSANAPEMLGCQPRLDATLDQIGLPASLLTDFDELLCDVEDTSGVSTVDDVEANGVQYWRIVHRHDQRTLVEFEVRTADSSRAEPATRLYSRLRNEADIHRILVQATAQIRAWTGFDRVMAYVFREDASGDVVAESRTEEIDSYLNMRFPASDIPAQARRLYILNPLRLIPDISYQPVALLMREGAPPVDMSFAVLRSVSPIHVEYLQNMGVQASMSVSIVVDGALWGLFACHHRTPLFVGAERRQACDTLAQFVSSRVQAIRANGVAARMEEATSMIPELVGEIREAEDLLQVLANHESHLRRILRADALVLAWRGKVQAYGDVPTQVAQAIVRAATEQGGEVVEINRREDWSPALQDEIGEWVGALEMEFDPRSEGRIIALRREQVSTVRWGGQPEKSVKIGPKGPRLTPRGSFAEWRETVRGRSTPWSETTRRLALQLQHELSRACMGRHAEVEQARNHLLAILGHDLRDPLQSIQMSAHVLRLSEDRSGIASRIDKSSGRMQSLITQVLDFSRAESGQSLLGELVFFDLGELVEDLVGESRAGHPTVRIKANIQKPAVWCGDRGRLGQAISNLISNARHYSEAGQPIEIDANVEATEAVLQVRNVAPPIPEELSRNLFAAFKQRANPVRNRTGLGIGLYIAHRIVTASGGTLIYRHENGRVVFEMRLPRIDCNAGN